MHIDGRVVLASRSPRRVEILRDQLGIVADTVPSQFPEDLPHDQFAPFEYCVETAVRKALDVYKSEADADDPPALLLAADTVVECQGLIFEKPRGVDDQVRMLRALRDAPHPHKVYTGVAAIVPFEKPIQPGYALQTYLGISEVAFRKDITDEEIMDYVKTNEAADAAGGYKVQGEGAKLIASVTGDKYNVVGLPVEGTRKLIEKTMLLAADDEDERDEDEYSIDVDGRQKF